MGLARGSALYVASVLGTGVLALPGLATRVAGPASVLAVALVLVASVPLAGTFAALAARHPDRGGVASAVRAALGPTAARATGYWFFLGVCAGVPVVAVLGAEYVVAVVGADRAVVPVVAVALGRRAGARRRARGTRGGRRPARPDDAPARGRRRGRRRGGAGGRAPSASRRSSARGGPAWAPP
nr:amino acid permease [Cellulosimicrobium sp. MM]